MDGFHALGTQGRSHPRQRRDPEEEKLLKSYPPDHLTAERVVLAPMLGPPVAIWTRIRLWGLVLVRV